MTDKDSAELGLASLKAFQDAKEALLNSLSEVEATITRNEETRDAIIGALGDIGVTRPEPELETDPAPEPDKKPAQRRGKKAPEVKPEPPVEPETVVEEPVVEHLPSGETQDEVAADAEAKGDDVAEALDDWTPGETAPTGGSKSFDDFDMDELQF